MKDKNGILKYMIISLCLGVFLGWFIFGLLNVSGYAKESVASQILDGKEYELFNFSEIQKTNIDGTVFYGGFVKSKGMDVWYEGNYWLNEIPHTKNTAFNPMCTRTINGNAVSLCTCQGPVDPTPEHPYGGWGYYGSCNCHGGSCSSGTCQEGGMPNSR